MRQHRVYMRLIEKAATVLPDADRIVAVREAVESLADIQWLSPPALHPRGGFSISFAVSSAPEFEKWIQTLDADGYVNVI